MVVPTMLVLRQAGARADESADAGPAFDPAFALQVIQRSPDRRPAQSCNASELMVRQKAIADVRAITEQMLDELLVQRHGRASSGERSCHLENTLHLKVPATRSCLHVKYM